MVVIASPASEQGGIDFDDISRGERPEQLLSQDGGSPARRWAPNRCPASHPDSSGWPLRLRLHEAPLDWVESGHSSIDALTNGSPAASFVGALRFPPIGLSFTEPELRCSRSYRLTPASTTPKRSANSR